MYVVFLRTVFEMFRPPERARGHIATLRPTIQAFTVLLAIVLLVIFTCVSNLLCLCAGLAESLFSNAEPGTTVVVL